MNTRPENHDVLNRPTPLARARFLASEKREYERVYPETKHGASISSPLLRRAQSDDDRVPSFVEAAAASTGWSRRTIQRAARIGARIDTALLDALADTPLARRTRDLEQIADMDADEQQELLKRLQDAEQSPNSLSALMPRREAEPSLLGNVEALKRIWGKSSRAERREFRKWLAEPDGQP